MMCEDVILGLFLEKKERRHEFVGMVAMDGIRHFDRLGR